MRQPGTVLRAACIHRVSSGPNQGQGCEWATDVDDRGGGAEEDLMTRAVPREQISEQ